MSRLDGRPVQVETDEEGKPLAITFPGATSPERVLLPLAFWREWIGVLDGEPERDIWRVVVKRGVCEIHCLRFPSSVFDGRTPMDKEMWLLHAWED